MSIHARSRTPVAEDARLSPPRLCRALTGVCEMSSGKRSRSSRESLRSQDSITATRASVLGTLKARGGLPAPDGGYVGSRTIQPAPGYGVARKRHGRIKFTRAPRARTRGRRRPSPRTGLPLADRRLPPSRRSRPSRSQTPQGPAQARR